MEQSSSTTPLSCADCGIKACKGRENRYPPFCPTAQSKEQLRADALRLFEDPTVKKLTIASAEAEADGYGRWCRVEDTIAVAKKMGVTRIGVASCLGLLKDAALLTKVLRTHGFTVYTLSCKIGAVPKTELGIPSYCDCCGCNACNPILQALYLNEQNTQFNIAFGLCVGHDSLFYRYSNAFCTTLVTKDRVTGHNPIAPLHMLDNYYKKLLQPSELDEIQEISDRNDIK